MVVTEIKKAKNGKSFLYVDYRYETCLSDEIIAKNGIKVGKPIDEGELDRIKKESKLYSVTQKAFNILSFSSRSKKELEDKLKRSSDEDIAAKVIDKVENLGLIDDNAFAENYANELSKNKKASVFMIRYKLKHKGISEDIIDNVLDNLQIDEQEQILSLLNGKFSKKMQTESGIQKAIASLRRLGYDWDAIKSALSTYNDLLSEG